MRDWGVAIPVAAVFDEAKSDALHAILGFVGSKTWIL